MKRLLIFTFLLFCAVGSSASTLAPIFPQSFGSFVPDTKEAAKAVDIAEIETVHEKVRFVGDVMLARNVENSMRLYGHGYPLSNMLENPANTYLVGNFESSIPKTHIPTKNMEFSFSVKEEYVAMLTDYGFTHLGVANNHSYDHGIENFKHTQEVLAKEDLRAFGDQKDQASSTIEFISAGGTEIALVGIYAVGTQPSKAAIASLLERAEEADVQVIYIHWGEEYKTRHNVMQEKLAHALIDAGADVIIGHHPHVVQDVELYSGGIIFYSLGNFIFDQYFSDDVQQGLLVELAPKNGELTFTLLPITSLGSRSQPRLMPMYERDLFLEELAKNSDVELAQMINEGQIHLKF